MSNETHFDKVQRYATTSAIYVREVEHPGTFVKNSDYLALLQAYKQALGALFILGQPGFKELADEVLRKAR